MNYSIRKPSPADTSGLYQMIRDHAAFEKSAASLTALDLESLQRQETVRFVVAAAEDGLLGYAAVTFDWSVWRALRYAHLDCLFVSDVHRGRGIGKRLLDEAKAIAVSEGVTSMEWQTPVWNEPAIRFYLREGAACQAKSRFTMPLG